ncbi:MULTISPECIES: cation:proton antiporter [Halomonadaceae]|uniref:Cation:proton antiporter n=1 Tax=Vreelandella janggokensis TaxID=370767 RepID=A0ABT4ISQ8_9GAMM|nr:MULTISPECIES: cation:proton antiporter [Halomonas]MCZ0926697.1 cation:proton antiporter [Halomonas janggokensis]MCZ0929235.1 cation:proton antiporter [Halomonas janggokensis]MDR5885351.1 cation:proton antiporter [Halomonas janggokensis]QPL44603.1 cation:proton antiporter [Halomonas sp. A40-4]
MTNATWFVLIGTLLIMMGLRSPVLHRLRLTPSIVYLAIGVTLGPSVLGAFHFNPLEQAHLLEVLAEIAVLVSLFIAGMKMPMPFKWREWNAPVRLAIISMTISVVLTAVFGYYVLALPLGAAILLGAILAPTDPVLATDVQVRHMGDKDPLRFTLTSEAGMNDGSAFPFVMLGLAMLSSPVSYELLGAWVLKDVLWSTIVALVVGLVMGRLLAQLVWKQRFLSNEGPLLDDFLGMGLIGVVYGVCLLLDAWGFLAVFAAAISLRQSELKLASIHGPNQETGFNRQIPVNSEEPTPPNSTQVSEGSMLFKESLERLSELVLVMLLGGMLFLDSWSLRAVGVALFLFLVVRPASVFLGLLGSGTPMRLQMLVGWFGVRGIGSIYYLMFAIVFGLPEALAVEFIHITLVVIVLSIVVHGLTVKPMMTKWWP